MNRRTFVLASATGAGVLTLAPSAEVNAQAKPKVFFSVIYPNHDGARFEVAYYRDTHVPLAVKVMKADRAMLVEGVPMGEAAAPYAMIAHFEFASTEALKAGLDNPRMTELRADVANFTDIKPTVMFGKSS